MGPPQQFTIGPIPNLANSRDTEEPGCLLVPQLQSGLSISIRLDYPPVDVRGRVIVVFWSRLPNYPNRPRPTLTSNHGTRQWSKTTSATVIRTSVGYAKKYSVRRKRLNLKSSALKELEDPGLECRSKGLNHLGTRVERNIRSRFRDSKDPEPRVV
ncbi:hypothetical protein WN55_00190 [Dufourea novaeangliae]|uniref:Uncharacterized protein n=1 Tax=Dufourea novaeangliae TaxID=178035 RepID=A0A154PE18_DUFNO|nr:hypothetical protein WN55_00190 [Dufourea novaeangliae]